MHNVFLEIGGNQGNRLQLIEQVKKLINLQLGIIIRQSAIYETSPWGFQAKQNFYNQVVQLQTEKTPQQLLMGIHKIEFDLGRVRGDTQYMSRTMDVDILFYDNQIIKQPNLQVPHQRMHLRKFVLVPMVDIAPDWQHPVFHKSMKTLLQQCADAATCNMVKA